MRGRKGAPAAARELGVRVGARAGVAPRSLRPWLRAEGSLTARLLRQGGRFEVQRLAQGSAAWLPGEPAALGLRRRLRGHAREVALRLDGEPVVLARSVTAARHLRGAWRALGGLGTLPLAALLFADRRVSRGPLQPLRLRRCGPWAKRIAKLWRSATGSELPKGCLWARASVFERRGASLQVLELFAPALIERDGLRREA